MKLSREQVVHIATLARIKLTDEEIDKFSHQLSDLLANFDAALSKIDANVDPLVLNDLADVCREDEAAPSYARKEILRNAPDKEDGCFKVKSVLE